MATQEQIQYVMTKFEEAHAPKCFKKINETQAGIGAVLRMLYESGESVSAGMISECLNISTARVAVLLKKMEAKGLITKEHSSEDARVTLVRLTDDGEALICEMREELYAKISEIIDKIGEKRLVEFFETFGEIGEIFIPPNIEL